MANHDLGPAYFANKIEQGRIKAALTEAIPIGCKFSNLLIVLTEMLTRYQNYYFNDEVHREMPNPPHPPKDSKPPLTYTIEVFGDEHA